MSDTVAGSGRIHVMSNMTTSHVHAAVDTLTALPAGVTVIVTARTGVGTYTTEHAPAPTLRSSDGETLTVSVSTFDQLGVESIQVRPFTVNIAGF